MAARARREITASTGSHDELVEKRGLYNAMWRQQIGERDPWGMPKAAAPAPEEAAVLDDPLVPDA